MANHNIINVLTNQCWSRLIHYCEQRLVKVHARKCQTLFFAYKKIVFLIKNINADFKGHAGTQIKFAVYLLLPSESISVHGNSALSRMAEEESLPPFTLRLPSTESDDNKCVKPTDSSKATALQSESTVECTKKSFPGSVVLANRALWQINGYAMFCRREPCAI